VLSLKPDEKITNIIPVRNFDGGFSLLMATKRGLVKKTPLEDFANPRRAGIIAVIRAPTELANAIPRVFMDDTVRWIMCPEDYREAVRCAMTRTDRRPRDEGSMR